MTSLIAEIEERYRIELSPEQMGALYEARSVNQIIQLLAASLP